MLPRFLGSDHIGENERSKVWYEVGCCKGVQAPPENSAYLHFTRLRPCDVAAERHAFAIDSAPDNGVQVDGLPGIAERVAPIQVHMPPGHRRCRGDERQRRLIPAGLVRGQQARQDRGVEVDDRVGDQSGALVAVLDVKVCASRELLLAADLRDGRAQLVIRLDAVLRAVHEALQLRISQVAQRVDAANQLVVFEDCGRPCFSFMTAKRCLRTQQLNCLHRSGCRKYLDNSFRSGKPVHAGSFRLPRCPCRASGTGSTPIQGFNVPKTYSTALWQTVIAPGIRFRRCCTRPVSSWQTMDTGHLSFRLAIQAYLTLIPARSTP